MENQDYAHLRTTLSLKSGSYDYYSLVDFERESQVQLDRLPYSIRILLEVMLRKCNGREVTRKDVANLASWTPDAKDHPVMSFFPGRVLLQDLTGVPVIVDLASLRSAIARLKGDPARINPKIPVDLVIDHSVQVDFFGTPEALQRNTAREFERNQERYAFLKWAQQTFKDLRVVPPATGIVHQVNIEFLTRLVLSRPEDGRTLVYPDTLVGTDSHTTMVNGLGVVGWGVGGIEAIAGMLGQPLEMLRPDVVGFKLTGKLPEGTTPTDLTLTITQMLRKKGVVDKFVEFYGPGLANLAVADRAMIANMSPEYGATIAYFPVDSQTLDYFRLTSRPPELLELIEAYFKAQHLFHTADAPTPQYSDSLELDMSTVVSSLAGPKRPQDRVPLTQVKTNFQQALTAPILKSGYEVADNDLQRSAMVRFDGTTDRLEHGSVVIAAITSCTNTSNPFTLVGAGLIARKAVEKGLKVKPHVKTSFAPGSRVVTDYMARAGLMEPLAELGFDLVGYGCTTCIGNSGPLPEGISEAVKDNNLVVAAVISGNRNFEGRVHPSVKANYLASPALVMGYALAGNVNIDLTREPLGTGSDGQPVYLRDVWPTNAEIQQVIYANLKPEMFQQNYSGVFKGSEEWNRIQIENSLLYPWDADSTYIQEPPFYSETGKNPGSYAAIKNARALAVFGDSITTDHISPAGSIPQATPAGQYLLSKGVQYRDFNSYGARRGNDRIMVRGTFANTQLKNRLVPGVEGGFTVHLPDGEQMTIFDASQRYKQEGTPLVILAGKEYGTGSSRDWAAKGPLLLGVWAVIAESFERIHRSNLAGMGIYPLQFLPGENIESLGLTGHESFTITGMDQGIQPGMKLSVTAKADDGKLTSFQVIARLNTVNEVDYIKNGGILQTALLQLAKE
jgi:aconitate hydratase